MKLSELIGAKVRIGSLSGRNIFNKYDSEIIHTISDITVRVTSDGKFYPTVILKEYPSRVFLFKDLFLVSFCVDTEVSEDNSINKESSTLGQKYPDWSEIAKDTPSEKYPDWSQLVPENNNQYEESPEEKYPNWNQVGGDKPTENYPNWEEDPL